MAQACLAGDLSPLEGRALQAPSPLWDDTVAALHELGLRGAIPAHQAAAACHTLRTAAVVRRHDPPRLHERAQELTDELSGVKLADGIYVAAALLDGCALVTVDARLARAAAPLVEVVAPADL